MNYKSNLQQIILTSDDSPTHVFSRKWGGLPFYRLSVICLVNFHNLYRIILVHLVLYHVHNGDRLVGFPIIPFHNFYMIEVSQNNYDKIGFKRLYYLNNAEIFL